MPKVGGLPGPLIPATDVRGVPRHQGGRVKILKARFASSEAFLDAYQSQFLHGGIFVATRTPFELASRVVVEVVFPELRTGVLLRGFIAWRRPPSRRRSPLRAGVGVEFLPSERRKRDFLLGVARRDIVEISNRRHRRLPVDLHVNWRAKEDPSKVTSQLDDIGERGAFVRTSTFLPLGSSVILEISAPGGERPVAIEGRVAWTHHTAGEEGMGIEFRCRDTGGARRLRELVRRLEGSSTVGAKVIGT